MLRVVIIGGGPAGSSAAISLLRAARARAISVTIVESKAFPRAKVCGEFVSPSATDILEELLTRPTLLGCGASSVDQLFLHSGNRTWHWKMPTPAWTLSRRVLDNALLNTAREAGAVVRQPSHVSSILLRDDGVSIVLTSGECLNADVVIHADGAGRHDPSGAIGFRSNVVGLKCVVRPAVPIRGIRMRSARSLYIGAVGVECGLATLAMVARTQLANANVRDADSLLARVWPELGPPHAHRVGDWLACPVGQSRYVRPGHPRSFRIGNAAAAVEPVGGEGIGLALWSGQLIGRVLAGVCHLAPHEFVAALPALQTTMRRRYTRRLRTRIPACRLAAAVLMRPALIRALSPLLRVPGSIIAPWYALTGKPMGLRHPVVYE